MKQSGLLRKVVEGSAHELDIHSSEVAIQAHGMDSSKSQPEQKGRDPEDATNSSETAAAEAEAEGQAIENDVESWLYGKQASNGSSNASTNATANATLNLTTTTRSPWHVAPLPRWISYEMKGLPVKKTTQRIETIRESQWPQNFCVHMRLKAPKLGPSALALDLRDPESSPRSIVMLGGHRTCGSFQIIIDDVNNVGMGVRCEKGLKDPQSAPLLLNTSDDSEILEEGRNYSLRFCYDIPKSSALIYKDGVLAASGRRNWHFAREGLVSAFVGTHVLMKFPEQLEEDAELQYLSIEDNSQGTTPTTTTLAPPVAPATTTGWFERMWSTTPRPPVPTAAPIVEVPTDDLVVPDDDSAKRIAAMRRRATTPAPHWDKTHHNETWYLLNTTTNHTKILRTEITTVTSGDKVTVTTDSHIIDVPDQKYGKKWPYGIQEPPNPEKWGLTTKQPATAPDTVSAKPHVINPDTALKLPG